MTSNLISVIIPCYNQGCFLDETLQSILDQSYLHWECIVVNDGSTDHTDAIAHKWLEKDTRFKYFHKQNGGRSSARNLGLENALGEYIQLLDADDLLHPQKFEKSVLKFESEKSDVVLTNFLRFRKNLKKTRRAFCNLERQVFTFESILFGWDVHFSIPIHCGMFKKEVVKNIRFNEKLNAYEDWFFWLDLYKNVEKTSFINENLAFYRMNPNGTTINHKHMEENLRKTFLLIYDSLDDNYKKKFFERIIDELTHSRNKFKNYKDSIFYRKLFYKLKGIFK